MDDDRPVSLAVLRSVIDSYRKKKESLEKRELQVKERLSALRRARSRPPKQVESYEINIETRESIVRSTSEMAPTDSYDTPNGFYPMPTGSFVPPQHYGREADDLLFPSQFSPYRHSAQSAERRAELIPEKFSRHSRPHQCYKKRYDDEFNSYGEDNNNTSESTRGRARKRPVAAEPRVSRDSRTYDELMVKTRAQLVNVSESEQSMSQIDIRQEKSFTIHRSRSPSPALYKDRINRKVEYVPEKPVRISPKVLNEQKLIKNSATQGRAKTTNSPARNKNEVNDSEQFVRQQKQTSSRRTCNSEIAEPKIYTEYQNIRSEYNVPHERMDKRSDSISRKSRSSSISHQPSRTLNPAVNSHSRSIKKQLVVDSESSQSLVRVDTKSRKFRKSLPRPTVKAAVEYSGKGTPRTQSPTRKIEETQSLMTRTTTGRSPSPRGRIEETRSLVTRSVTPRPQENPRPRSQPTPERKLLIKTPYRSFDESYSNNFLIFLIRKSLPRAMTSLLLPSNGFQDKTAHEVLNYVDEVETIKKLICDELDRREAIGRPFKILRKEKDLMMKNFLFANTVSDRLKHGVPVQQAIMNLHDNGTSSALQLEVRTVRALREARDLLGGDLPDPDDAYSLQEAAQDCLHRLGRLQKGRSESRQVEWLGDSLVHIEKRLPPPSSPSVYSHHHTRRPKSGHIHH